ncbi:MAG: DUF4367 domain-containing protein [Oscillospiraceae bacterium]|nr:DUF4367 domain-containing protein [Oscillospiraceae bacterium]
MSMTRSEFNETFRSVISEEFADIPPESEIQYEFSKEFLDKMQKLINGTEDDTHKAQKKQWSSVAIKRIVALAAALIVLFAGIMSVGAVREPVVNFIFKTYEGFKRVLFSGDSLTEIDHVYAFAEVPEGFVETQRISNKEMNLVRYENGETGAVIVISQSITTDYSFSLDSENGEIKTFDTNGKEVKIYCAESQTLYSAFWVEDTYIMELTYSGETDTDELLRLINTIK